MNLDNEREKKFLDRQGLLIVLEKIVDQGTFSGCGYSGWA
jgi:hypothetical protein